MGKILLSQPEKLPPEVHIPGKKLQDPTVSNFNNTVIGGQAPSGDPFLTTQQMMNAGEAFEQKHQSRKKMLRPFEPELFTSPITGEPIANYGTWADDLKKQQSDVGLKKEPEDEEDDDKNDPIMGKLKSQLKLRGAKGIVGLGRLFKIMDDDGSRTLSFAEFKKAMKEFGMVLSDSELIILFKRFGSYLRHSFLQETLTINDISCRYFEGWGNFLQRLHNHTLGKYRRDVNTVLR